MLTEYILLTTLKAMSALHTIEIAVKSYDKRDQLSSTKLTRFIGQSLCTSICKMERGTLPIYTTETVDAQSFEDALEHARRIQTKEQILTEIKIQEEQ